MSDIELVAKVGIQSPLSRSAAVCCVVDIESGEEICPSLYTPHKSLATEERPPLATVELRTCALLEVI